MAKQISMRILTITLLVLSFSAAAQKQGNIWYFGQQCGLDFSSGSPVSLNNGMTGFYAPAWIAQEGTSSISDSAGNFLFSCDGLALWDKNGNLMQNGDNLMGGASSTQASLIVPDPANTNLFYVFTTDDFYSLANGLRYSVVDLCQNGGNGAVVSGEKNIQLLDTVAEKLAAVRSADSGYWLMAHRMYTDEFHAYKIDVTGLGAGVVSHVGTVEGLDLLNVRYPTTALGQMKFSPDGKKLALVIGNQTPSILELFHFNDTTGVVSDPIKIDLSTVSGGSYGVEFSPNSQMLYCTSHDSTNMLLQFDISVHDSAAVAASRFRLVNCLAIGLQLGPDGKIYISSNQNTLSVINDPDISGNGCNVSVDAVNLSSTCYTLPGFIAGYNYGNTVSDCNGPLAIKLINIAAINRGPRNHIDWSTASETPGDQMILQRSFDGRSFKAITEIAANGKASNYSYWDEQPTQGINYYRLQLRETSGNVTYSKVVSAIVNTSGAVTLSASPNPVLNQLTVNVTGAVRGTGTLTVTDPTGKTLLQVPADAGTSLIDMSSFAAGIYFIRYSDDAGTLTTRVSKL
jgi:hypothetical protein